MMTKQALRAMMRERASALTVAEKMAEAGLVFNTIEQSEQFEHARNILLYYSLPNELPTHDIVDRWRCMGKHIFLPRMRGNELDVVEYTGELQCDNRYGIEEPVGTAVRPRLDIVIVPVVAIDHQGHRLGHGKGYYDRFLAALPTPTHIMAVALRCQLIEYVPHETHDVPVHTIITAEGILDNRPI